MSLRRESFETARSRVHRWVESLSASLAIVGITTLAVAAVEARLQPDHLVFIYLAPAVLIAIRYGIISAIGAIITSSLAAAYFLYAPRYSFMMARPLDVMELALFCLLALLASQVVSGFAGDDSMV